MKRNVFLRAMRSNAMRCGLAGILGIMLVSGLAFTGCSTGSDDSGPGVNKTALAVAISAAEAVADTITVDINVTGIIYVTAAEKATYKAAIVAAKAVKNNAGATQAQVDKAVADLATATTDFNTAQKTGTNPATKANLTTVISVAEAARDAAWVDTTAANVPIGTNWVTAAEKAAYQAAIAAAQDVETTGSTADNYRDAIIDLVAATTVFNAARKDGTKTVSTSDFVAKWYDSQAHANANGLTGLEFEWKADGKVASNGNPPDGTTYKISGNNVIFTKYDGSAVDVADYDLSGTVLILSGTSHGGFTPGTFYKKQ